ncbi:MAG TPA: globin [Acidimicrobiales bacterium]
MGEQAGDELFQVSVHQAVGGDEFFVELVERFYAGVAEDPVMRPMYPDDLTEPKRHLAGFLIQFWGGSQAYSEERGHPRLRMRHVPFRIGPAERDAWFRHMVGALNSLVEERDILPEAETAMRDYFQMSAEAMRNAE